MMQYIIKIITIVYILVHGIIPTIVIYLQSLRLENPLVGDLARYQANIINLTIAISFLILLVLTSKLRRLIAKCILTLKLKEETNLYNPVLFFLLTLIMLLLDKSLISFLSNYILQKFSIDPSFIPLLQAVLFLIVCLLVVLGIKQLITRFRKESNKLNINNLVYINDEPINHEHLELLGRDRFIKNLAEEVINFPFTHSFVFGLEGSWGEGKTSILNLIKKYIQNDEQSKSKFIILNYNPWEYINEQAMIIGFYDLLNKEINKTYYIPKLKKLTYKFLKDIGLKLSILNTLEVTLEKKFEITQNQSINDTKEEIREIIENLDKRILIIIDDLDRLYPAENTLSIFRVVKKNIDFNNITYILSYDYSKLKLLFQSKKLGDGYLNKIVQKKVSLPEIRKLFKINYLVLRLFGLIQKNVWFDLIRNEDMTNKELMNLVQAYDDNFFKFNKGLSEDNIEDLNVNKELKLKIKELLRIAVKENIFNSVKCNDEEIRLLMQEVIQPLSLEIIDDSTSENFIIKNFITIRDIKRFLNSFATTLAAIHQEVNLTDLFYIEIIRNFNPDIYEYIKSNRGLFTTYFRFGRTSNEQKQLKDYINQSNQTELLTKLFLDDKEVDDRRLSNYQYFDRYFTLDNPPNKLSKAEFFDIISDLKNNKEQDSFLRNLLNLHSRQILVDFSPMIYYESSELLDNETICSILDIVVKNINSFDKSDITISTLIATLFEKLPESESLNKAKEFSQSKKVRIDFLTDIAIHLIKSQPNKELTKILTINVYQRISKEIIKNKKNIFDDINWTILFRKGQLLKQLKLNTEFSQYLLEQLKNPKNFYPFVDYLTPIRDSQQINNSTTVNFDHANKEYRTAEFVDVYGNIEGYINITKERLNKYDIERGIVTEDKDLLNKATLNEQIKSFLSSLEQHAKIQDWEGKVLPTVNNFIDKINNLTENITLIKEDKLGVEGLVDNFKKIIDQLNEHINILELKGDIIPADLRTTIIYKLFELKSLIESSNELLDYLEDNKNALKDQSFRDSIRNNTERIQTVISQINQFIDKYKDRA